MIDQTDATALADRTSAHRAARQEAVDTICATISLVEDGQPRHLSVRSQAGARSSMSPAAGTVAARGCPQAQHIIFEPDGAMLHPAAQSCWSPPQAGLDAYYKRMKRPRADEFDFAGVAWLGRTTPAQRPRSPRAALPQRAARRLLRRRRHQYLGLGQNAHQRTSSLAPAHVGAGR
jgi:hypothetical protein